MTGTMEDIVKTIDNAKDQDGYVDPTIELPTPPPDKCSSKCGECPDCNSVKQKHPQMFRQQKQGWYEK